MDDDIKAKKAFSATKKFQNSKQKEPHQRQNINE
jgi:hypothetical protein